jgi:hypothetical protein
MTCQRALFAAKKPRWPFAFLVSTAKSRPASAVASAIASATKRMPSPGAQPPLILSLGMQRESLAMDHAAAVKRRDMQALHRIEADLRNVTNRILSKGVCFND